MKTMAILGISFAVLLSVSPAAERGVPPRPVAPPPAFKRPPMQLPPPVAPPAADLAALQKQIRDPNPAVRKAAVQALFGHRGNAAQVLSALYAAMIDSNPGVRASAIRAFGHLRRSPPPGIRPIGTGIKRRTLDPGQFQKVPSGTPPPPIPPGLDGIMSGERSLAYWLQQVQDRKSPERMSALFYIAILREQAIPAVPTLVWALGDESPAIIGESERAIGSIGPGAKAAVPSLIPLLAHADQWVRTWAAFGLGQIGPDARDGVPGIAALLKDPDAYTRKTAVLALGWIGPDAKDGAPALAEALKDADWEVRECAAESLERLRAEAKPALAALVAATDDPEKPVRSKAGVALSVLAQCIGPEAAPAVPTLVKILQASDWGYLRAQDAAGLGAIGPAAKAAVPILQQMALSDVNPNAKKAAAEALPKILGTP
ncbi:MAG: HEAT repeat domain-containing protein [Planctomycetota bacterium]